MKKVAKKVVKREILNVVLGSKLPVEVKATINVLDETFKTQAEIKALYLVELKRLGSNSNSNLETRLNRSLYSNLERAVVRTSIQSKKFNIASQVSGIEVISKNPVEFKSDGNAVISSVRNNSFKIRFTSKAKKSNIRKTLVVSKGLENKVAKFKAQFNK